MKIFLLTVCVVSLLTHGVASGGAMHSVATNAVAKSRVTAAVAKAKQVGMALVVSAALACGMTGCEYVGTGELIDATSAENAGETIRIGVRWCDAQCCH